MGLLDAEKGKVGPADSQKKQKETKTASAKKTAASKSASAAKSATGAKSTAKTSSSKSTTAKSTATKTSSSKSTAKSAKATTTNKSGKKIVNAAPVAESKPASSGGIDMNTILNVVGKLASGDKNTTGTDSGQASPNMLSNVLGALTGGESGLNLASIAELILPMLKGNSGMLENFKKRPTQTIEKLIGIDLPDDKIDPIVEMVLGKLGLEK